MKVLEGQGLVRFYLSAILADDLVSLQKRHDFMRGDEDGRLIVRNALLAASDLGLSRVDRIVEDYPIYQLDVPEIGTIEWWYGISVQVGGGPWFNVRIADEKSETDGWKQLQ